MHLSQRVSQIYGVVFVIVAIVGLFTSGGSMQSDPAVAPRLFGLFPVNLLHNLFHLAWGGWGLVAAREWITAQRYLMATAVVYLILAVLGYITPSMYGLLPIGGNDIWLHIVLAVVAGAVALSDRRAPVESDAR
ncbi:MAG TPA: DUF4383 domain-containing protein [Gemmatimonadaceae bacterium]